MMVENEVEDYILAAVKDIEECDSLELLKKIQNDKPGLVENHQHLHSFLVSLESKQLIKLVGKSRTDYFLTEEGQLYATEGTPEYYFGKIISENPGQSVKDAMKLVAQKLPSCYSKPIPTQDDKNKKGKKGSGPDPTVTAFGNAKQHGYITVDKSKCVLPGNLEHDKVKEMLNIFVKDSSKVDKKFTDEIINRRKLVAPTTTKWFGIVKDVKYKPSMSLVPKPVAELTEKMVKSGEWKDVEFAPLNFEAMGAKIDCGHEHPLLRIRYEFRQIFLQMGFEEMDTSHWVESSFWNFDTLFQGQQHPCRDIQDTFFISDPKYAKKISDHEYFERVKNVHEKGDGVSIGLRYKFDEEVPLTNIMRTHTTAVSSRYLKKLADEYKKTGVLKPSRYFSIDRVYRNETLDATHLAEFFQIEGLVIKKGASLADLMSLIKEFFSRIGLTEIEFKPAYNPYTEPSMEIFAYHPGLGKWIEVGNSGMFRPEMLGPMGIPPEYTVAAWGCSLERPTMIEFKIDEIRKLEGPLVSFDLIENASIARLTF
ncbi:phenylalanine--tRNA ligase alpha subunit [Histomonas meleagridis]|uniref:phenylalanine--tRNA ligase alpha subunit n=1 Tax=Histomonas meleagridis TaxID=135588 RepID=UPI00355A7546|nr:phenylalanine--tRNA ligase alpha subunit [Histomonas meleagridis]KAH0798081.1 phenylalanine--tRNA ligase alpha subunit [Histomonas meleagridis]